MNKLIILVFAVYLLEITNAYSCFREPWMLSSSSCGCAMSSPYTMASPCSCNVPCKCFRNPANICEVCDSPSPVCQCLSKCKGGCGCNKPIYFPEVEYPATIMEMNPFYYGACWSY